MLIARRLDTSYVISLKISLFREMNHEDWKPVLYFILVIQARPSLPENLSHGF